ncbi:MAG: hypothetical protein WAO98_07695 [Alphaproteobacteria bacterium]
MSRTGWSLAGLGARIAGAAVGADFVGDIVDAKAGAFDLHDGLSGVGNIPGSLSIADVHVPDMDAITSIAGLGDLQIDPNVVDFMPPEIPGEDIICNGPSDAWGRVKTIFDPPIMSATPIHTIPTLTETTLSDLGYAPLRPGENADFGGVLGGGYPTDQYGNGPIDVQGNNRYRDIWGHPPQNGHGGPLTP